MIDLTGQFPTVIVISFEFNNLIIMTGFKDLIAICRRSNLTKGDINIVHCPIVSRRHFDGIVAKQIIVSIFSQGELYLCRRFLLVKFIIPDLLHANGLGGEFHGFRCYILFYYIIYLSRGIAKRSVQMRICQQIVSTVSSFADTSSFQFVTCHGFDAVVQVRNGIIRFLAGPYRKLNRVDPSLLQFAHCTEVPGHTVRFVIGCAGGTRIIVTQGFYFPFGLFAACRCDIVLKAARFAGSNIRAHIRERRNTVIYGDVCSSHTGNNV